MNKQADPIDTVIIVLKRVAQRRKKKTDWEKVDRDLRAYFAELALVSNPVARGLTGETYRLVGVPDASITEARELLRGAKKAFAAAKSLPTVFPNFAVRTYGAVGRHSISWEAMKTYTDALAELETNFNTLEDMFKETLSTAGKTRGMTGPLIERVVGTPIQQFLQRLIRSWQEATGSRVLGESFEDVAKQLIEAACPGDAAGKRAEIGHLKRQIENAKRRGEFVQSPWTHKTKVMRKLTKRPNVRRRRR